MKNFILNFLLVIFFACLTALGANLLLPFLPYHPYTLQIVSPLLAGVFLGRDKGALSQVVFVFFGLLNLPYFNSLAFGFPAPSLTVSPQFAQVMLKSGYLIGFVAVAYLVGKTVEERGLWGFWSILTTMFAGVFLLYIMAVCNFYFVLKIPLNGFFGWSLSFFLLDLLKAFFVAFLYWRIKKIIDPASLINRRPKYRLQTLEVQTSDARRRKATEPFIQATLKSGV